MTTIFVDAVYWIATLDVRDTWHNAARNARQTLGTVSLVTTDEILVEVLNTFSGHGEYLRYMASGMIYRLRRDPHVLVVEQSRASFDAGLIMYETRHDKGYSLVDCISMNTMRRLGLSDALTHDRHFAQEGFKVLIH